MSAVLSLVRIFVPLALVLHAAPLRGEPAPSRPFVRVEGTRFVAGEEPFFFVGANLNVMHGPRARGQAARTIAAAAADGLTVGRVWALGEGLASAPKRIQRRYLFRAGPEGWVEEAYLQLDRVLAEAGKRGLRLIVTLSNHWKDYGGIPMYLRWAGDVDVEAYGFEDRFFSHPLCLHWFWQHVERIVTRVNTITGVAYRDDPTIFAWELQNELHGTPEAAPWRRAWFALIARRIRGLDPNHLVVPGTLGYKLQLERSQWLTFCEQPGVSFCDQHIYPEEHLLSRGRKNLALFIADRVQLAHYVAKKPVIFGEYGFADRGSPARRAAWHRYFLQQLFRDGGNGALVWIYQPTLHWHRRFGVLVDRPRYRPVRRALAAMARRIRRTTPTPQNPALGPERGTEPIAPTHATLTRQRRPHQRWRGDAAPGGGRRWTLALPVDRFYRAHFEEAGSWDGGILVHAYGRRTGWFDYRFVGPGKVGRRLELHLRLSSEYPSASAPAHGFSRVEVLLDDTPVGTVRAVPDNGRGTWYTLQVEDPALLRRLARGIHTLRLRVSPGPEARGVAIYGRETRQNREPVENPGPPRLVLVTNNP